MPNMHFETASFDSRRKEPEICVKKRKLEQIDQFLQNRSKKVFTFGFAVLYYQINRIRRGSFSMASGLSHNKREGRLS